MVIHLIKKKHRKCIKLSFIDTFRCMTYSIKKLAKGFNREVCKNISNFINDNNVLGKLINIKNKVHMKCLRY